ncbi:MAG: hypothetical protein KF764_31360 [Labilithrix sp.]|nr:hypothetical protein [Labilithrix sp.]
MRVSLRTVVPFVLVAIASVGACVGDDPAVVGGPQDERDGGPSSSEPDGGTPTDDAGGSTPEGGASCTAPLADCNGDGVCETSLVSDPENCGACGHDCGAGGTCTASECQPVTLAKSLTGAVSVAVNASALVVLKEGGPGVCPKDGCGASSPTSLVSGEYVPSAPHTIYVDAVNAYWLGKQAAAGFEYALRKCAIAGCGLAPTSIDDAQIGAEMRGEGNAVLRYDETGSLSKIYVDGSKAKEYLTTPYRPSSFRFALASGKMAFSNTDGSTGGNAGVWIGDFTNAVPTKIMNIGRLVAIANGSVFASRPDDATHDAIYVCPFAGCGGVGTKFGANGATTGTGKIADIAADASGVYWVETIGQVGRVMRCTLPACAGGPKALAVAQDKPVSITLDDKFVYWVNAGASANNGAVLRVAK